MMALHDSDLAMPADIRLMNGIANAVFALVGAALVVAGVLWAMRLPAFAVREIEVEGDLTRNSVSTIRANAMPRLSGTFFTVDLIKTRMAFEQVPWVRNAVVRRIWPNRLAVQLQEHQAAALWREADGDEKLVDVDGEVFDANPGDVEDQALPTFSGPDGTSPRVLSMYQHLLPLLQKLGAGIDTLSLSGGGSWSVDLDTGASIELGRGDEAAVLARTERFVRTVPAILDRYQRPLAHADLRHVDAYAVKLNGVTTTASAAPAARARKH